MGLVLPENPGGDIPALPEDLTDVSDSDLMMLFAEFTEWANYANAKRSMAEIDESEAEAALDLALAKATVAGWDEDTGAASDRRVTIAKARRTIDEDVQEATEAKRKVYARRKLLQAMSDIMERNAALVSRELSRRIGSADVQHRSARFRP